MNDVLNFDVAINIFFLNVIDENEMIGFRLTRFSNNICRFILRIRKKHYVIFFIGNGIDDDVLYKMIDD